MPDIIIYLHIMNNINAPSHTLIKLLCLTVARLCVNFMSFVSEGTVKMELVWSGAH